MRYLAHIQLAICLAVLLLVAGMLLQGCGGSTPIEVVTPTPPPEVPENGAWMRCDSGLNIGGRTMMLAEYVCAMPLAVTLPSCGGRALVDAAIAGALGVWW